GTMKRQREAPGGALAPRGEGASSSRRGYSGRGGERRLLSRSRDGEADPHPGGAVPGHGAEDQEGATLPRHETDIGTLPGWEALFESTGRSVFERGCDGADRNSRRFGDDFDRVRQVRVLVLEVEQDVPSLRNRQDEAALAEP